MTKEQKQEVIETLKNKFSQYANFYITDTQNLSVAQITNLRRHCFDKQVEMKVAKNTLIKKALESLDNDKYSGVYDSLHQVTALMFSDSPKEPALIISSFRKSLNGEKPLLKAAFLNGDIFVGDNQLISLTKIKTKNELIGEVIGLLMSPIQRVIGALQNKFETAATEGNAEADEAKTEVAEPKAVTTEATPAAVPATEAKAEVTQAVPAPAKPGAQAETAEPAKAAAAETKPEPQPVAEAKPEVTEPAKPAATETKPEIQPVAEVKPGVSEPNAKAEVAEPVKAVATETKPAIQPVAEAKPEVSEPNAKAEVAEPAANPVAIETESEPQAAAETKPPVAEPAPKAEVTEPAKPAATEAKSAPQPAAEIEPEVNEPASKAEVAAPAKEAAPETKTEITEPAPDTSKSKAKGTETDPGA